MRNTATREPDTVLAKSSFIPPLLHLLGKNVYKHRNRKKNVMKPIFNNNLESQFRSL